MRLFYSNDNNLYIKNLNNNQIIKPSENPHRIFSEEEIKKEIC
jgi:hypothetical protein